MTIILEQQHMQQLRDYPQTLPPSRYASSNTVVVAQPIFPPVLLFREHPVRAKCPGCGAEVLTSTRTEIGTFTWILCLILVFMGCVLGCCFIPFCVDGCKDVVHTCPNCRAVVGKYSKM